MEQEVVTELTAKADRLYTEGKLLEARSAYQSLLDADPELAWAHSRVGAILAQLGDEAGAEAALEKALGLDPKLAQAHSNLGNIYYGRGEYDSALAKYQEAAHLNPDNPVFHENLHAAYKKLGKLSEAVTALKQAHKLGREAAKTEAKERFQSIRKKRLGCLGTSLIAIISLAVVLSIIV
jgi:tetratricopeptide (TPR) repeat protein